MRNISRIARVVLLAAMLLAIFVAASQAYIGKTGLFHCRNNGFAQVDPIAQYGVSPSDHLHMSAGANLLANGSPVFSAFTTPDQLTASGTTTSCDYGPIHDLVWVPAMISSTGTPVAGDVTYYVQNNGYTVQRPPNGLRFVAGNHGYVGAYGAATYTCTESNGSTYYSHLIPPASTGCKGVSMGMFGPGQCWYSAGGLGKGMGSSGPAANITGDNPTTCAANGGTQIPLIEMGVQYTAAAVGGHLSSDPDPIHYPGSSEHFDFVFGFENNQAGHDALDVIDRECLNDPAYTKIGNTSCSVINDTGPSTATLIEDVPSTGQPDWGDPDRYSPETG